MTNNYENSGFFVRLKIRYSQKKKILVASEFQFLEECDHFILAKSEETKNGMLTFLRTDKILMCGGSLSDILLNNGLLECCSDMFIERLSGFGVDTVVIRDTDKYNKANNDFNNRKENENKKLKS